MGTHDPKPASAPPADSLPAIVAEMRRLSAGFDNGEVLIEDWADRIEAIAASAQARDKYCRCEDCHEPGATLCTTCAEMRHTKPVAEPVPECIPLNQAELDELCASIEPVPMLRIEDFYSRQGPRKVYRIPPFEEAEPAPVAYADHTTKTLHLSPRREPVPVALTRWGRPHTCSVVLEEAPSGYWTPWHIAQEAIADHARREAEMQARIGAGADDLHAAVAAADAAEASLAACRAELQEMADHGLRFDLNPTHDVSAAEEFWHDYFRRADRSIRERAAATLRQEAT